jgi:hypothetical protein
MSSTRLIYSGFSGLVSGGRKPKDIDVYLKYALSYYGNWAELQTMLYILG